jgi:Domain of unknown function (DUF1707)
MSTVAELRKNSSSTMDPPGSPAGTGKGVRASDAERAETVARLHDALGEGRLDLAETDVRTSAAYAAVYRDELPALLADLPGGPSETQRTGTAAPTWAAVWSSVVWRARIAVFRGDLGTDPPSAGQQRVAFALVVFALVWVTAFAFLGAAVVG